MTVESSSKTLKIFGILGIIFGIIGAVVGLLALAGGGLIAADDAESGALVMVAGIIATISGIVSVIQGILSVRAAKDNTKIKPAWIFALVSLAFGIIGAVSTLAEGGNVISSLPPIAISVLVFMAANTIKKAVENPTINSTPEA